MNAEYSAGTDSAGTDSAGTDSAATDSAGTDSAGTDSAATDSAATDSAGTDSVVTDSAAEPGVGTGTAELDAAVTDAAVTDGAVADGAGVNGAVPAVIRERAGEITALVCRVLETEPESVGLEDRFVDDLGADSMKLIELLSHLEIEFDVEIDEDELERLVHLQGVYDVLGDALGA
ncbi:acyl carrier protein [Prauserella halophila]|nr:acyl carrier protein [Prauserella halophila]